MTGYRPRLNASACRADPDLGKAIPLERHLSTITILLVATLTAVCLIAFTTLYPLVRGFIGEPNIDASCTMNGLGQGECQFVNKGDGKGTSTVAVAVTNHRTDQTAMSSLIFSGLVLPQDVREWSYLIQGVSDLCTANYTQGETWMDVCGFIPVQE